MKGPHLRSELGGWLQPVCPEAHAEDLLGLPQFHPENGHCPGRPAQATVLARRRAHRPHLYGSTSSIPEQSGWKCCLAWGVRGLVEPYSCRWPAQRSRGHPEHVPSKAAPIFRATLRQGEQTLCVHLPGQLGAATQLGTQLNPRHHGNSGLTVRHAGPQCGFGTARCPWHKQLEGATVGGCCRLAFLFGSARDIQPKKRSLWA